MCPRTLANVGCSARPDERPRGYARDSATSAFAEPDLNPATILPMAPGVGRRVALVFLACAVGGVLIFGGLVWRAVTIAEVAPATASERFSAARATLPGRALVEIDDQGRVTRRESAPDRAPQPIKRLKAMVYQPRLGRIVRAEVPFWFLKLKGPAAQLALRDTGIDLDQLAITPSDLERYGPRIVVDQVISSGSRLLVWTE
jgi:hypothetical protein